MKWISAGGRLIDFPTKVTSSGGRYQYEDDWQFYDTQVASFEFGTDKMLTWEGLSCNGFKTIRPRPGCQPSGNQKDPSFWIRNAYQAFDKGGKLIKQVNERSLSATTDTTGIGGLVCTTCKTLLMVSGSERN